MILYRDTYVDILFKVSVISSDVCGYSRYSETVQKRQLSVTRMYLLLICHTNLNIGTHTWYSMIFNDILWYSMILYDIQYGYDILLIWYGYSIKAKIIYLIFENTYLWYFVEIYLISLIFLIFKIFLYEQIVSFWLLLII